MRSSLTHQRIHTIRTVPMSDRHYAQLWRKHHQTIRNARVGITWRRHPTPVDTKPRVRQGNWGELSNTDTSTGNPDA